MIDIDKIEELNEMYGNRVDELRKALGFLDQGEFNKFLSGNDERGSNTSRIESGTNAKFSSSVRLACIFNVELIVRYQLYKPLQIVEYTGSLSFEERYKSDTYYLGT